MQRIVAGQHLFQAILSECIGYSCSTNVGDCRTTDQLACDTIADSTFNHAGL
jgi:hypothetical protein